MRARKAAILCKMMQNDFVIPTVASPPDEVVKVRVVPAALLPLVATSASSFGGIHEEERALGELDDGTHGCLSLNLRAS